MSWSGPVAGGAPYQPPPYANGQSGYGQQPPYQYGQQPPFSQYQPGPSNSYGGPSQRPPDNRPPKKKGNPIITRYPPPPGYRGPAQPQGPFNVHQHAGQYQPPTQPGFLQAPPAHPNYPSQGFTAAPPNPSYPPQGYGPSQPSNYPSVYPQRQNYQWAQQGYQPNPNHSPAPTYPSDQGYTASQTAYSSYPPQTAAGAPHIQASGWPQSQAPTPYPPNRHHNTYGGPAASDQSMTDANATPTPATVHLVSASSSAPPFPPTSAPHDKASSESSDKQQLFLAWDDWDFDFDGAIWPKSNEPVDPNLSLGVIIWHPAKQTTRALPATFEEAEGQSLGPSPEKLGNGESVSIYFTAENSHEAFLDVRQTDEWEYVQNDPVFVVFTDEEMQRDLVALEDCIAQRDRPDEPVELTAKSEDAEMQEGDWSVMDHLEQALSADGGDSGPTNTGRELNQPDAQTQEDVLAMLGVTGSPKPLSQEPMPSFVATAGFGSSSSLPEKPQVPMQSFATSHPQIDTQSSQISDSTHPIGHPAAPRRPLGSISPSLASGWPPPPPPPPKQDRYDPWNPRDHERRHNNPGISGGRGSPAQSEASDGTAAGSDFESEKPADNGGQALETALKFERSDSSISRKRSYGDTDQDDERQRQHDDHTKRKRRSQIDAAYR